MYYADIKFPDIANGTGVRVSLFVSGCTHCCEGCFNAEAWDFTYGQLFTDDTIREVLSLCEYPIDGLSILGGEPMHPRNQSEVLRIAKAFKSSYPDKTLWIFSGYTLEELCLLGVSDELLSKIDVLVDGRFDIEKKDIRLKFKGSNNQRIIDMKRTLQEKSIVLFDI